MGQNGQSGPGLAGAYRHAALGLQFAGGVVVFMGAGFLLDRWLGLVPLLTVAGTLIGATLSFLSLYTRLRAEEEAARKAREGEPRS